ncbi:hypothetical protein DUNSADRAFT_230 [Dunaliella salina]|uniref:Uncharacterized protein n=1 Tax=Dunaliella salina TaxID=3046 RepID=A0ABQ7GYJ9_DUNSA|nr:hypothetical protein DUNSADRAFT_230 [Dunaliella salina]|eukprot:KAF5839679.1 hypothetical protein DUNSADRAFT_230 [Dunaliella salina]
MKMVQHKSRGWCDEMLGILFSSLMLGMVAHLPLLMLTEFRKQTGASTTVVANWLACCVFTAGGGAD